MNSKKFIERKTKILATLGPSSNTIKKIVELSKGRFKCISIKLLSLERSRSSRVYKKN
jgi:hypothetical protein